MENDVGIPPLTEDERARGAHDDVHGKLRRQPVHPLNHVATRVDTLDQTNPVRAHMREVEAATHHDDRPHKLDRDTTLPATPIDDSPTLWDGATAWAVSAIVALVGVGFVVAFILHHK
ncbi:MAG: hypothetical protein QM770_15220 [Tepidisphaeraceae bacterium]